MDQQTVTLVASVIAAVVALCTLFLNSRFTLDRERQLVIWRKNVDRLTELEEHCGVMVEELGSYKSDDQIKDLIAPGFAKLETLGGRLSRYPDVRQSVRDLQNVLGRLWSDRSHGRDDREVRKELEPAFRKVITACDAALGTK